MAIKSRTAGKTLATKEAEFLAKADQLPGEKPKRTLTKAQLKKLERMNPKSRQRTSFSLRPNHYQLALLKKAAEINDISMQTQALVILVPALEEIVNVADNEAANLKRRLKKLEAISKVADKIKVYWENEAQRTKLFELLERLQADKEDEAS